MTTDEPAKDLLLPIRPIWATDAAVLNQPHSPQIQCLLDLERRASRELERSIEAARNVFPQDRVESVESLFESARFDLVAGVELARGGYFKQTYSLWRSWYEQTLFALYFIEAPLHRIAWRRAPQIELGDEPRVKLMLHQMLPESGDKAHPFGAVYSERFKSLFAALRVTVPKKSAPLSTAEHRLRDLSQGVHGTYQPSPVWSVGELQKPLETHILRLFELVIATIGIFLFSCVQSQLGLSETQLTKFLNREFQPSADDEDENVIAPLLPQLWAWLDFMRET
ncbi:MAG TPA: hypothetical protein VH560_03590 [Polyangia bacterium]|jgi:hypothetical protein|nr:hypothetical protein [Polyangia bacterium]